MSRTGEALAGPSAVAGTESRWRSDCALPVDDVLRQTLDAPALELPGW